MGCFVPPPHRRKGGVRRGPGVPQHDIVAWVVAEYTFRESV